MGCCTGLEAEQVGQGIAAADTLNNDDEASCGLSLLLLFHSIFVCNVSFILALDHSFGTNSVCESVV